MSTPADLPFPKAVPSPPPLSLPPPPPPPIGINLDGVLIHDGLSTPKAATRFAWVRHSQAFDYIEKNIDPTEDFTPYFALVERYNLPIQVFGGIFCAGVDEARMRWGLRTGAQLGAKLFNMQLYARHADGHPLSDHEVVRFYVEAMEHGQRVGCLPSLEVHVDMWSEQFHRVERVAELLARDGVPLRLTLDHSHLIYKIGLASELALSGLDNAPAGGRELLAPEGERTLYRQWLREGWVVHAHTRSVGVGVSHNAWMNRRRHQPGRAIQYPLLPPPPGTFHADWDPDALEPWKQAVRDLLRWMQAEPQRAPERISCEFIPFPDYGGGARYSIWDNNIGCAQWLRQEWVALQAAATAPAPAPPTS